MSIELKCVCACRNRALKADQQLCEGCYQEWIEMRSGHGTRSSGDES